MKRLISIAVPLLRDNVDTDSIMPQKDILLDEGESYGSGLFSNWREDPGFILNLERYSGSKILIAGKNFGCGSSREHAVWGLVEYGFRVILSESFGSIFYNNCFYSGLAPIVLSSDDISSLVHVADGGSTPEKIRIDFGNCTISCKDVWLTFVPANEIKRYIIEEKDFLDDVMDHIEQIRVFKEERMKEQYFAH